jgi:2-(1,2-epoxy-1,2-dihydrophenyl)acetyl-CoA isomerase
MAYETIIYEKDGGIATLTFNRPQVLNAQNTQQATEMRAAVREASQDDAVRVLVVTGAGRGFHAGDDVKQVFLASDREQRRAEAKLARLKGVRRPTYFEDFYKPIVGAINGAAVGAGLEIALQCDVRIASENAKFGYFYVRRGIIASYPIGVMMLPHLVGVSRALEMMMSGELIDAAEAERIGLVSRVVPQEKLMDEARKVAGKLMQAAPLAQQAVKRAVYKAMFEPYSLADFMATTSAALGETEDHLEGSRAFAEKREPHYRGR